MESPGSDRWRSIYRGDEQARKVRDWCADRLDRWTVPHRRDVLSSCVGLTHVVSVGTGSPVVVVVPGADLSAALLEPLAAALAPNFSVLLLDLPGQPGLSADHLPRHSQLAWYGWWLADVLAQAVPGKAIVVGHALGGAIALTCGSPRIAGRALVSTAGLVPANANTTITRTTAPWLRATPARSASLLRRFLAPDHQASPHLSEWYDLVAQACRIGFTPPALPSELIARRTRTPRLVVAGEHDVVFPPPRLRDPVSRHLAAQLIVLPAGHLVVVEQPRALASLISTMSSAAPEQPGDR
ncbi:Putative aminoacrylate hydrolase RutD [Amycolatopsis sp. YIM 10]|nr:Putative aminoacrylate hydrolase RutD [Amycolatopsis sp. YIM 10]